MNDSGDISKGPIVSFRDPGGCLLPVNGRILRVINKSALPDLHSFLRSETARQLVSTGRIVSTNILDSTEAESLIEGERLARLRDVIDPEIVVEHERVPFPSFPYEWSAEMLCEAAHLTLDMADMLLNEGLGLKDATPYNVLFVGAKPVFVDILSIERRDPSDPVWLPYGQFVRTFLMPLLANKYFGMPLDQIFTTRRDGLEPEEVYRLCGPLRKWMPPFLASVSIPTWLAGRHDQDDTTIYNKRAINHPEKVRFILKSIFKHLRRVLDNVAPKRGKKSVWSDYMASNNNYTTENFTTKHTFVESVMAEFRPKRVLDVGCNTGHFSAIAARSGATVVAIDYDSAVASHVWLKARAEGLDILPLVMNLARPSPAIGWRNQECPSFLERARGAFDAVLMLAVIHHMLVSERIPLSEIIDLAAELTSDLCVIEFIAPDDSMFRRIARGRNDLFKTVTLELFEANCQRRFTILRSQRLGQANRWLYLLRRASVHAKV